MLEVYFTKLKKALSIRFIFDNWYELLVKYMLVKLGRLNVKLIGRINSFNIEISCNALESLANLSDALLIFLKSYLVRNNIRILLEANKIYEILGLLFGWIYDNSSLCWIKNNVKFKHMYSTIIEIFDFNEYDELDVCNRVVVDIGAFIGDSAIYFALKGAKKSDCYRTTLGGL